jgi:hypothetical protein
MGSVDRDPDCRMFLLDFVISFFPARSNAAGLS